MPNRDRERGGWGGPYGYAPAHFSGETESLKTWLALILAKAEKDIGHAVA